MSSSSMERSSPLPNRQVMMTTLLATLTMLFAGFTSAYLVRRTGTDWTAIPIPSILWITTAVLVLTSISLEIAKRAAGKNHTATARTWVILSFVLGSVFILGQLYAWRTLAAGGIFLPTNPHSSFFYLLTATHGAHVIGGLALLSYVIARLRSEKEHMAQRRIGTAAVYWHFVDIVWLYLFVLLKYV